MLMYDLLEYKCIIKLKYFLIGSALYIVMKVIKKEIQFLWGICLK